MSDAASSEDEASNRRQHWLIRLLPVPENFYDIKASLTPIAEGVVTGTFTVALYALSGLALAGSMAYYLDPSQHITATVVQSGWAKEGFECAPLQAMELYGLKTAMTFDECVGQVRAVDAGALVQGTRDGYTHWDWPFMEGATVGYFTPNYTDPVQQSG